MNHACVRRMAQVRRAMPEAQLVFLTPPSWDELVRRVLGRPSALQPGDRGDLRILAE